MNKFFKKAVALSVGLAMAAGAGIVLGSGVKAERADAATGDVTIDFSTTTDYVSDSTSSLVYAHTDGGVKATLSASKGTASTNTNNYYPGTSGKSYTSTRFYKNSSFEVVAEKTSDSSSVYITGIVFTATIESYATALANSTWTNGSTSVNSKTVTVTADANVKSLSCSLGGTVGITAAQVSWSDQAVTGPIITVASKAEVAVAGSVELSVTYSNVSADGIAVSSDSNNVTVPTKLNVSGSGTTTLTIQGSTAGSANVTLQNGTVQSNISVIVFTVNQYDLITSAGQLVGNQTIVVVEKVDGEAETAHALASGQGSSDNNRAVTEVAISGSSVSNLSSSLAEVKLEKDGDVFHLKDAKTGDYYYGESGKNNLKVGALTTGTVFDWDITITDGSANIKCVGDGDRFIQYNSTNNIFSTYTGTQKDVSIYMVPEDIPAAKDISSIEANNDSVEAGSSITFHASYLPIDATEDIVVTVSDDTALILGSVVMSNGSISVELSASSAVLSQTDYTITIAAENHSSVKADATITVTVYQGTHNRIDSIDGLYNGASVIFGESETNIASSSQSASGNNVSTTQLGFASDGSSLSNVAGYAKEFIAWQVTVGTYSGWAFYSEGTYLVSTDGGSNYLKRSAKLTELAVFSVSITDGVAEIVSVKEAGSDTNANKILFNVNNNILSCYKKATPTGSGTNYREVSLYVASSKTDAVVAGAFENFFMHMDSISTSDKGTGLCKDNKNGYYSFAKSGYSTLTVSQRSLLSQDSIDRLSAWASANEEVFDPTEGTFTAVQEAKLDSIMTNDNSVLIVIAIVGGMSLVSFASLLILKKKKAK